MLVSDFARADYCCHSRTADRQRFGDPLKVVARPDEKLNGLGGESRTLGWSRSSRYPSSQNASSGNGLARGGVLGEATEPQLMISA